jgi:hypothetical protein
MPTVREGWPRASRRHMKYWRIVVSAPGSAKSIDWRMKKAFVALAG